MLANMKIEADNVGQKWGGIFNVAWSSPNRPPDPGDRAAVYAVIPMGNGGQEGHQPPHVLLCAQRILQGLSTNYAGLVLVKVGYVRATSDQPPSGSAARASNHCGGARLLLLHACESRLTHGRPREHVLVRLWLWCSLSVAGGVDEYAGMRPLDPHQLRHSPWWGSPEKCAVSIIIINPYDQPVSSPLPPLPHAASTTRPPCRSSRQPGLKPPRNNRRHRRRRPCTV